MLLTYKDRHETPESLGRTEFWIMIKILMRSPPTLTSTKLKRVIEDYYQVWNRQNGWHKYMDNGNSWATLGRNGSKAETGE